MKATLKAVLFLLHRRRFTIGILLGNALVSFVAGSLFTARLAQLKEVKADNDRVFQLMIYHTVPGSAGHRIDLSRRCKATEQTQSERGRLLGAQRGSHLEKCIRLPCRSFQPSGSRGELASASLRPGVPAISESRGALD